jgi:hypothetical protein
MERTIVVKGQTRVLIWRDDGGSVFIFWHHVAAIWKYKPIIK